MVCEATEGSPKRLSITCHKVSRYKIFLIYIFFLPFFLVVDYHYLTLHSNTHPPLHRPINKHKFSKVSSKVLDRETCWVTNFINFFFVFVCLHRPSRLRQGGEILRPSSTPH